MQFSERQAYWVHVVALAALGLTLLLGVTSEAPRAAPRGAGAPALRQGGD